MYWSRESLKEKPFRNPENISKYNTSLLKADRRLFSNFWRIRRHEYIERFWLLIDYELLLIVKLIPQYC